MHPQWELVKDGLVDVREAMRFTGLSRSSIYMLMENGSLPYVTLGRARRIPRNAWVELAASNLRGGWANE